MRPHGAGNRFRSSTVTVPGRTVALRCRSMLPGGVLCFVVVVVVVRGGVVCRLKNVSTKIVRAVFCTYLTND